MDNKEISKAVINRLPRYYRYLGLLMDQGIERISSGELSRQMNVTAGQQGYGYNVRYLYTEIGKILGLDQTHNMIIIGAGRLGQALANYVRFEKRGFLVTALFDRDPEAHGSRTERGTVIHPLSELGSYLDENRVDIAALTIPTEAALEVTPILTGHGVRGIWNFAHTDLEVPDGVAVQSVHLSESLMQLSYKINHQ